MNINKTSLPIQYLTVEIPLHESLSSLDRSLTRIQNAYGNQTKEKIARLCSIAIKKIQYIKETISISANCLKVSKEEVIKTLDKVNTVLTKAELVQTGLMPLRIELLSYTEEHEKQPLDNLETEFNTLFHKYKFIQQDLSNLPLKTLQNPFFEIHERSLSHHPILSKKFQNIIPSLIQALISSLITKIKEYKFIAPFNITLLKSTYLFDMKIDMGLSIVLDNDELKINGTPAQEHGVQLLLDANRLLEMLRLQVEETPYSLLGVFAARQGFILSSMMEGEDFFFDPNLYSRWKAAFLASNFASLLLSKEGEAIINRGSIGESLLDHLVEYSTKGSITISEKNYEPLFVNISPLSEEKLLFQHKILVELIKIQALLEGL